MTLSFRLRLLLTFWIVIVVAQGLPTIYFSWVLRQDVLEEERSKAIGQLHLVDWLLSQQAEFADDERFNEWLTELGQRLKVRITYMAAGGRIIADSQVPFTDIPSMENHANRPEIVAARSQELGSSIRYSGTVNQELLYVAKSVERTSGAPTGVVRLALPFSPVRDRLEHVSRALYGLMTLMLVATAVLSALLTRRLRRSIAPLIRTAEAIGGGEFSQRVRTVASLELTPLAEALNRMAELIQTHVHSITTQKRQLEAILDGMQEGVMLLDVHGRVHTVNQALRNMVPSMVHLVGRRPLEVVMSPELQEACDRVLRDDADAGAVHSLQISLEWQRSYDVHIVRVQDQHAGLGAIVVLHDISELKRLERVRKDFVSNVSHELRTPLTSIKGYGEALLSGGGQDPDTLRSFLQVILKNADHMARIINDLLELARLEAKGEQVQLAEVNPTEALAAAWKICSPMAQAKHVELQQELPEHGLTVRADFDQLVQVFRNLLENAVRYSPAREAVTVSHRVSGETVAFTVCDRGPGIPRQEQHRIFERFYRVEKHRSKDGGSTGLGLAICRHIIHNHGGRIWVESLTGGETRGSTFCFTLPSPKPKELEQP
jgi:two-component system, OmpR family, phosphate regulon sensor histidine kinase PhoR